jgi:hypothetical protein
LVQFSGDLMMLSKMFQQSHESLRPQMSLPDDDTKRDNVVRLGTETLFAIGDELRRMYDADLRSKPSARLERLMQLIERGENLQ